MKKAKKESYFWTSYSDLMTTLFFVMLVFFAMANRALNEQVVEAETAKKRAIESEMAVVADAEKLKAIERIQKAIENIDSRYFIYDDKLKVHRLNIQVQFKGLSADMNDLGPENLQKLKEAGEAIAQFLDREKESADYLLVIEGQASKDTYLYNDELSYKRALSLRNYWEANGIKFPKNCKVMVSGSGVQGSLQNNDIEKNRTFLIQILPKPGTIQQFRK